MSSLEDRARSAEQNQAALEQYAKGRRFRLKSGTSRCGLDADLPHFFEVKGVSESLTGHVMISAVALQSPINFVRPYRHGMCFPLSLQQAEHYVPA